MHPRPPGEPPVPADATRPADPTQPADPDRPADATQQTGSTHPPDLDRPADADRRVGERYRLVGEEPLGTGGMGEVWRATDTLLERTVALKRVLLSDLDQAGVEEVRARALREGRIAARLSHPNVVTLFDVILSEDELWLVLEYVPWPSADRVLAADGPLPPSSVARIGAQIADALVAAHAAGIRHRDLTPANVLVDPAGSAKLTDFGIAQAVTELRLTGTGVAIGTPAYLAPEVARGEGFTEATDVYGLGATLYALVEGQPPFGTGDPEFPLRLMHSIATRPVPPPTRAGPLTAALVVLTATDPGHRPDAAAARELLEPIAGGAEKHPGTEPAGSRRAARAARCSSPCSRRTSCPAAGRPTAS